MSLKNFVVRPVDPRMRDLVEAQARRLDARDHTHCLRCERPSRFGEAVCRDCRATCAHPQPAAGFIRKSNGDQQPARRCLFCGTVTGCGPVRRGEAIDDWCLRDLVHRAEPCARCGTTTGTELHHWAPRNTFPDADDWPTSYLCRDCHRTWHRTMDGYRWHARRAS
ncbi:MAG: hypothetical protein U0R76_10845 [Candidatus Nanopelagicales bacterium]